MSAMPGNPHYPKGGASLNPVTAQAVATLALAYEQRTANLIAAQELNLGINMFSAEVSNTIIERLGLEGDTK